MSPSFAVPAECPWRKRLRPSPTAALAAPSLHLPQAALGFATVVLSPLRLPIPSHRHLIYCYSIHYLPENSKQNIVIIQKFILL